MKEIVNTLLEMPDSQIDASMQKLIRSWSEPPKAIEVLEVLDKCINGSLSSGLVVRVLQMLYDTRCKKEGTTHDECVKKATWRGPRP